ncbi:MAG TPA: hypothetical protein VHK01_10920, partial [Lacipirellulaceae bacterium]|nr:hypothetical protein [Lacipirellulaceae bacterium]
SSAFDVNGDGLGDNRDLFLLGEELVVAGAGQAVLDAYTTLLLKRGDLDSSGTTNSVDMALLYSSFGSPAWLTDLNVDGAVNIVDVQTMITNLLRTVPGDFNLDGSVGAADYAVWRKSLGASSATYMQGDADLDRDVDDNDYAIWRSQFGFLRGPLVAASGSALAAVPEPATSCILAVGAMLVLMARRSMRRPIGLNLEMCCY